MPDIDLAKFTREEAIAYIEALQKQNREQAAKIKEQEKRKRSIIDRLFKSA